MTYYNVSPLPHERYQIQKSWNVLESELVCGLLMFRKERLKRKKKRHCFTHVYQCISLSLLIHLRDCICFTVKLRVMIFEHPNNTNIILTSIISLYLSFHVMPHHIINHLFPLFLSPLVSTPRVSNYLFPKEQ